MVEKTCSIVLFGEDNLTPIVLEETYDVIRNKFFLEPKLVGTFEPPRLGMRDHQYFADILLSEVINLKGDAIAGVGLTPYDMYTRGLNFVFGLASPVYRAAVVSYYRLRTPDRELFISRIRKELTHEMGHVFGLEHCTTPGCVMNFSNSLYEVDLKSENFCPKCKRKLMENLRRLGII
jgi:archaemetzincin